MELLSFSRRGRSLKVLPIILIILLSALLQANSEVITLTSDTFSDKVKEKDTVWFVKFCVPWCKYCKNLGTLWDDLAREVEGEDEIEIGEVDCTTDKAVCSKVDIHSYPTFKAFYDGEEFSKYKGKLSYNNLVSEEGNLLLSNITTNGVIKEPRRSECKSASLLRLGGLYLLEEVYDGLFESHGWEQLEPSERGI